LSRVGRRSLLLAIASLCVAVLVVGCRRREPPEAARARAQAQFLQQQLRGMEALVAKAEGGGLETQDQIAIGISEDLIKGLVQASLPREVMLGQRVRLRVESAEAYFRGDRSALVLRARISSADAPRASARVELAGALKEFQLTKGQLVTRVSVVHFSVLESSLGNLAADVIENLVKDHIGVIENAIPPLAIPVKLEESVRIGGLTEGVVVAKSGVLPLTIAVAQVIPVNQRLWILLDAKAGPWQADPQEAKP
jgi:hypothetical protein